MVNYLALCAQIVPNGMMQEVIERHRKQRPDFLSPCKCNERRGVEVVVMRLKIRWASAHRGSTPRPGTT